METKFFRVTWASKSKYHPILDLFVSIIAALGTTYAALFAPPRNAEQWLYLIMLVGLTYSCVAFFIYFIWWFNPVIELNETHIIQHNSKKSRYILAWSDISKVEEIKPKHSETRLALHSRSGKHKIVIDSVSIIEDYEVLRQIITEKTNPTLT